ncbi:SWIB/MDM2 domain containing protein [Rhynchospora pubera]|uniref:SWIB/MDM2 domain containing protein n=1 Tax=Rhynchospora pubera TaxID=906938 RepID=A0AAV8CVT9_9POAL|nr:SWIB/MDM2 domain containing protein [Rhynchospora pubera]
MVTDQELASCVETLLRQAGPAVSASNISVPNLVRHLEAQLGLDLSHKEPFIRNQVALLLTPQMPKDRFAPNLNPFQQFQYLHPSNLAIAAAAAAAAASASPYQAQQELSFKYQAAAELVGATAASSATSVVKATVEPARSNAKPAAVTGAGTKESASNPAKRKGGPGGLNKVCGVSPELQAIVGQPTMARTEIVKQLWAYIRKNNLQDPNNKRKIICNDELRVVFETDCTDMFKMNKLLAKHIIPLKDPSMTSGEVGPETKKLKAAPSANVVSFERSEIDKYPILISDALAQFLGTEERKMLHSDALGRVWDHIKSNSLEDPRNAMVILCDSKLKQLFGREEIPALRISELLSQHCFTQS